MGNENRPRGLNREIESEFAALSQQVRSLEAEQGDIKVAVVNLDKKMDAGFSSINQKIDSRNVTPWVTIFGALAVLGSMLTTAGWLAIQPIQMQLGYQRDEGKDLRRRIDDTRSQLDWTNGWLAGKLSTNSGPPGPLNKSERSQ